MSKTITEDINKYMQECSIYKGEDNLIYVGPKGSVGDPTGEELFSKSNIEDNVLNVPVFDGDDGIKYITYEDILNILKLIEERKKEKGKEIERLNKELEDERKKNRKAIEYIEEKEEILLNCDDDFLDHDEMIDKKRFKTILEILKGEDKK